MPLESPRAQWAHWPRHYVHPTTEQGACDKGLTQSQVPVPWPPEDPYLEEVSFNEHEFEDMEAEKWLMPDDCPVEYISNCGPLER